MVPQTEEIVPKPEEETTVLAESKVFREEISATKQPELVEQLKMADQRQTIEP